MMLDFDRESGLLANEDFTYILRGVVYYPLDEMAEL